MDAAKGAFEKRRRERCFLNKCAVEVLSSLCGSTERWPPTGLIFATSGGKRYTAHSKGKEQLDKEILKDELPAMPPWRLHDLRRTLATGFQKLGVRFEVTEAVLNHLGGSKSGGCRNVPAARLIPREARSRTGRRRRSIEQLRTTRLARTSATLD